MLRLFAYTCARTYFTPVSASQFTVHKRMREHEKEGGRAYLTYMFLSGSCFRAIRNVFTFVQCYSSYHDLYFCRFPRTRRFYVRTFISVQAVTLTCRRRSSSFRQIRGETIGSLWARTTTATRTPHNRGQLFFELFSYSYVVELELET